jgi:hypothetical protein
MRANFKCHRGGGFVFSDNIFYGENTLTFFKIQVERFPQQSIEIFGGWFFYYFLRRVFQNQHVGNLKGFIIPKDG